MSSEEIFASAIEFEKKIHKFYLDAMNIIDDVKGQSFFKELAADELSHVSFLEYSLDQLKKSKEINLDKLKSSLPSREKIENQVEKMKGDIPERMLGDIKRVLTSALKLEVETSSFYKEAYEKSEGPIKSILGKFYEIEQNHVDLVQFELDMASKNGYWLDYMEIDMEHG
ncbi:MAG: ferritin family protein [Desulfobacteraceae bacterium]|nr:ferritin family protein [Desulfobacteraceae bacterium]